MKENRTNHLMEGIRPAQILDESGRLTEKAGVFLVCVMGPWGKSLNAENCRMAAAFEREGVHMWFDDKKEVKGVNCITIRTDSPVAWKFLIHGQTFAEMSDWEKFAFYRGITNCIKSDFGDRYSDLAFPWKKHGAEKATDPSTFYIEHSEEIQASLN